MARFDRGVRMGREDGFVRREGGAYIVEVCPRTEFSFGYNATTPATFAPLAQAIPSYDWTSGLLIVRVHAVTWVAGTLAVEVRNVSITPDDPSVVFGTGRGQQPPYRPHHGNLLDGTWVPETAPELRDASAPARDDASIAPPAHVLGRTSFRPSRRRGQVISIIGRRRFQFGVGPSTPISTIPITGPLHLPGWVQGVLVVRIHEVAELPTASTFGVQVRGVEVSPDEPSLEFDLNTNLAQATVAAPGLVVDAFVNAPPPWVRLRLFSRSGATAGTQDVTISVELLGRFR